MRPLAFAHSVRGPLHRSIHAPGNAKVVEHPNWPVLTSPWPGGDATPYRRFAVNNNNTEEIAVYLGLIWALTEGRTRFGIPTYYRDSAARWLRQDCAFVDWEYEVDAEEPDPDRREKGFVPGRSSITVSPPPSEFEREHRGHAGLFRIDTFAELVTLLQATLGDASAEINLFAVSGAGQDEVASRLRGPSPPRLDDVLRDEDDLFVDLSIGVDLGSWDSLLIYARRDIGPEVAALTERYETAVAAYEQRVPDVTTVEAMLIELERLAAGRV